MPVPRKAPRDSLSSHNHPVLYSFRRCPYAMRTRMALAQANIRCEWREIVLRNKPQAMLDISPKGTVPVLHLGNGDVLEESLDIMYWALEQHDPDYWLGADKALTQELINLNDGDFKRTLDRFKYPSRFVDEWGELSEQAFSQQAEQGAIVHLQRLEEQLTMHHGFLCHSEPTLADVALFPFVRQFSRVDENMFAHQSLPQLQQWLIYWQSHPLWQQIMLKLDPWQPSQAPVWFPTASAAYAPDA